MLQVGTRHQTVENRVAQIRISHGNEQRGFLTPQLPAGPVFLEAFHEFLLNEWPDVWLADRWMDGWTADSQRHRVLLSGILEETSSK